MRIMNFINSDYSIWTPIVQIGIIALAIVIANVIRRKVKIFRNLLFPTAIIAGFIGLAIKYVIVSLSISIDGNLVLDNSFLEMITYHSIALGFIAMGLKTKESKANDLKGRPVKTGMVIVST